MPRNPLNPRLPPKNKETGRRKGYRRHRPNKKNPNIKALWQDPEYLAKMAKRSEKMRELHRTHPEKFSRAGIPDGMSRSMVAPLWQRAYELADKFIQIMKDTGRL